MCSLAGAKKSVLLAFLDARVTRQQLCFLENGLVVGILLHKSPGNAMTNRLGLAVEPATGYAYDRVNAGEPPITVNAAIVFMATV